MQIYRKHFRAMGGGNEITLAAPDAITAERGFEMAIREVLRIEAKYSRYQQDSLISMINAGAGGPPVLCDEETCHLLDFADHLYRQSSGLFDITSGILRRAWNFAIPALPANDVLREALSLIGWQRAERTGSSIRLPQAGMEIDFGGFGKEYAADRAAALLLQQGFGHGYVNLGGDLCAIGPQPTGAPWLIGIADPRQPGKIIASIPLARGALATSGDYEKYFDLDGQRYCHVLDPRTGYPVSHWRSVSVLAPLCIAAGSYSTVAMLKEDDGLAFLAGTGVSYLAVDQQGGIHSIRQ